MKGLKTWIRTVTQLDQVSVPTCMNEGKSIWNHLEKCLARLRIVISSFVRVFATLPDFGLGSQSSPSRPAALWRSVVVRQLPPMGRGSPARSEHFFGFLLALFFSVYTVHPAIVTSGLNVEFVSDCCTYQVTNSLADMAGPAEVD